MKKTQTQLSVSTVKHLLKVLLQLDLGIRSKVAVRNSTFPSGEWLWKKCCGYTWIYFSQTNGQVRFALSWLYIVANNFFFYKQSWILGIQRLNSNSVPCMYIFLFVLFWTYISFVITTSLHIEVILESTLSGPRFAGESMIFFFISFYRLSSEIRIRLLQSLLGWSETLTFIKLSHRSLLL